ncbi:MAG TPA: DUF5615 family PIN-like protein [Pyrinomonadaceae bacterium]|nr:DUF5615 family PIN-like protein [Pyrinomonadaceae bacterium]
MSVRLYMDVHVRRAVTNGLRLRGVDVLTAQEDGARRLDDAALLDRATALGRVLFTQDDDLLKEAAGRRRTGAAFAGVIYAHQLSATVGQCIDDLELIAKVSEPAEWAGRLLYLPLK